MRKLTVFRIEINYYMIGLGVDNMNNTKEETISIIELTLEIYNLYQKALYSFKAGAKKDEERFFHQGDELLLKVSQIHAKMLSKDMNVDLLLAHAEDLLISVQLYRSMIQEIQELYKKFPTLKGN